MKIDWKFAVSSLLALLGVVAPIIWSLYDDASKSIEFKLKSSVGLKPEKGSVLPDFDVIVDGVRLDSPFLSTFDITNGGSKPIQASDFEGPIEIIVPNGIKYFRARILSSQPEDINPNISFDEKSVKVRPLLLNSKDSISIAVITSGPQPAFNVRARVSGVSKVSYVDDTANPPKHRVLFFHLPILIAATYIYFYFVLVAIEPSSFIISRKTSVPVVVLAGVCVSIFSGRVIEIFGENYSALVRYSMVFVGIIICLYVMLRNQGHLKLSSKSKDGEQRA